MAKVTFVNEHRTVEVASGRLISDVADELGIQVCREEFAGTGLGDYTVWVKGSVSAPGFWERLRGVSGWRRHANRTRVLGDVEVWTQPGLGSRLTAPRPVSKPPNPTDDPDAPRFDHEHDAAGTAWNPFGHPKAVGRGEREAPKYEPPAKKKAKAASAAAKPTAAAKAAAKPKATAVAAEVDEPTDDESKVIPDDAEAASEPDAEAETPEDDADGEDDAAERD